MNLEQLKKELQVKECAEILAHRLLAIGLDANEIQKPEMNPVYRGQAMLAVIEKPRGTFSGYVFSKEGDPLVMRQFLLERLAEEE